MDNEIITMPTSINIAAPQVAGDTRKFLAQIVVEDDFARIQPGRFNILSAPRGWGKTTFMFDQRILDFARDKKHIIYLVHTKTMRANIHHRYPDETVEFIDAHVDSWLVHRNQRMWSSEPDVNKIHVMCYQTFAALLRRDVEWLNDIDLIVWDEFDDIYQYYQSEIDRVKREFPDLSRERLAALLQEGKHTSMAAFIYQIHTMILEPARIRLIAISATPESAAFIFGDSVNYILNGRLNEIFDARVTIYIENIASAVLNGMITPNKDMCPWVFTPKVSDVLRLAELFTAHGFHVLTLWSYENPDWRGYVTDEMKRDMQIVHDTGFVPAQYDCVITNQVTGRGIDIYDKRFQDWLCDSHSYSDIGQFIRARYQPERKYILTSARGLIEFVREEGHFPACYYAWHTRDELKQLLTQSPIYTQDYQKQLGTWAAVKKEWGEKLEFEDRTYGAKHIKQYRIKGEKK